MDIRSSLLLILKSHFVHKKKIGFFFQKRLKNTGFRKVFLLTIELFPYKILIENTQGLLYL